MTDWSYHELALTIGYRALGEKPADIAAFLGRDVTEVNTIIETVKVLDEADMPEPKGSPAFLRRRRIPPSLVASLAADRRPQVPGEPPAGRSTLSKKNLVDPQETNP
jgi:hypothetical protein